MSGGRMVGCALAVAVLTLMTGCGISDRDMSVNVIVYNYSPTSIGNVRVQGQPVLGYFGEYGPGGTGGSVYCCIEIEPGEAEVQWEVGGPVDSPEPPGGVDPDGDRGNSAAPSWRQVSWSGNQPRRVG